MGLLHDAVNLLNLDGTLIHQKNLLQFPVNRVDVQNVRLPSFYGTPWALKQLDKQIRRLPDGITLIGQRKLPLCFLAVIVENPGTVYAPSH